MSSRRNTKSVVTFGRTKNSIMTKTILLTAAVLLALAVAIGAFGAHGLKAHLSEALLQTWKTGVEYHFYHALGLLLIGVLSVSMPSNFLNWSSIFLFAGIILFSGSLYILSITGIRWLGAITPLGGISFILGWVLLAVAVIKDFTVK
jgi:uncharacterized membrane protein YgdD (TMEM256/DUF423 family)